MQSILGKIKITDVDGKEPVLYKLYIFVKRYQSFRPPRSNPKK